MRKTANAPFGLVQHAPGLAAVVPRVPLAPACIQAGDVVAALDVRVSQAMDVPEPGPEDIPWTMTSVCFGENRLGNPPPYFLALVFRLHHGTQQPALQCLELGLQLLEGIVEASALNEQGLESAWPRAPSSRARLLLALLFPDSSEARARWVLHQVPELDDSALLVAAFDLLSDQRLAVRPSGRRPCPCCASGSLSSPGCPPRPCNSACSSCWWEPGGMNRSTPRRWKRSKPSRCSPPGRRTPSPGRSWRRGEA